MYLKLDTNWWMIKNSAGRPDAMLTISIMFSIATLLLFILGGSSFTLGSWGHFALPTLDTANVLAVLGFVAAYVKRRSDSDQLEERRQAPDREDKEENAKDGKNE